MKPKDLAVAKMRDAAATFYEIYRLLEDKEEVKSQFYRRSALLIYSLATSIETEGDAPITGRAEEYQYAANLLRDKK